MKKLIVLLIIMSVTLFSQDWNTVVQTTIPFNENTGSSIDLFTNKDGNHVLVNYYSGSSLTKYYLLNSSGSVVRSYTFETQSVDFASIDGNNDKIYVVYKLGNQLKVRKSTNAGISWTTDNDISPISIGNNSCSNVDIIWSKYDNSLNVTWATKDNEDYDETYYRKLSSIDEWSTQETVTNYSNEVGGFPTVSVSQDRVHFSYSNYSSVKAMTRDKYSTTWQNPQTAFNGQSFRERVHASNSKLFDFYYKLEGGMGNYHADLYVTERSLSGTTWPSGTLLHSYNEIEYIVSAVNTADSKTHIVYDGSGSVIYRSYNGTSWASEYTVGSGYYSPKIYSVSNDLFVVWSNYYSGTDYVTYRQYDAIPLAPTGLTITEDANNHPRLNWNVSPEPDRNVYKIYRYDTYGGGWQYLNQTTSTTYTDQTLTYCHAVPPAQCPDLRNFSFRVTVVDNGSHESSPSNEVTARLVGGPPPKIVADPNLNETIEYSLGQNYPNPFNPITTIDYSIQSSGLVLLKVYDMLGTEVASLVNEIKEVGNYSVEFNATELPSGIYFYTLTSDNFMGTKKLILLK